MMFDIQSVHLMACLWQTASKVERVIQRFSSLVDSGNEDDPAGDVKGSMFRVDLFKIQA